MWCCGKKSNQDSVVAKDGTQIRRLQALGLRRDAPPPQVHQDIETPVLLNVYSLVEGNEKLAKLGMGIYHTGVIVYGIEWSYGEVADNPNASGLFCVHPGQAAGDLFRTIRVGVTTRSPMQVDTILHRLENEWRSSDYHILHHNCNHFAQRLCNLLSTVEKLVVPSWCNRAARVSDRVVPRKLATKVMRMMDDDPPKAKPPAPTSNVNELPVSIIPPRWYKHPKIAQPPRYCYVAPSHRWSNSQMSTPHSSQVSSPDATDLEYNRGSFVPPPGFSGGENSHASPVEPLSSLEERQPSSRQSTRDAKKRQRPHATAATTASQPAVPLSAVEEAQWPPLVPSRGQSVKSTSIRSNPHNQPTTPLQQSYSVFSPASRGSSRLGSFAGARADNVNGNEVIFTSGRSGIVPVLRRRDSARRESVTDPQGRPPIAPQSHHSGGSPQQVDAELTESVFERLSLPDSCRATSLVMVIPEIDFTPHPDQATPVGVVLHRSDADPDEPRGDASSVASSNVGEDVVLVMESEMDAALAAQEEEDSLASPGVRLDSEARSNGAPKDVSATPAYNECRATALQTPTVSPLTAVEQMRRRHKQQDAHALAAHNPHRYRQSDDEEANGAGFTDLRAVADDGASEEESGAAMLGSDTCATLREASKEGRYAVMDTAPVGTCDALPPALTAHEERPAHRPASLPPSEHTSPVPEMPSLEPPAVPTHQLSDIPPPPGETPVDAAMAGSLSSAPRVNTDLLGALPRSPLSQEASESSHTVHTNGRGTSEVLWQGEPLSPSAHWRSTASDRDADVPSRSRAASVSDRRMSALAATPRRPQLLERRRSEARTGSTSPRSRRASLHSTPQSVYATPPHATRQLVLAEGGVDGRGALLDSEKANAAASLPPVLPEPAQTKDIVDAEASQQDER